MIQGIDHIVIGVADLEQAKAEYTAQGFTVVTGGRHLTGTHNALISFADGSYIELIAFYEENRNHKWWDLLQMGGGLIDFCLQTDNIAADRAAFVAAGMAMSELQPSGRLRPDGYHLKWSSAMPSDELRGRVPFLIVDETPRAERVPALTDHANRVQGIGMLTAVCHPHHLPTLQQWYSHALGQPIAQLNSGIRVPLGHHAIQFVTKGDAAMLARLAQRGSCLWSAALVEEGEETAVTLY